VHGRGRRVLRVRVSAVVVDRLLILRTIIARPIQNVQEQLSKGHGCGIDSNSVREVNAMRLEWSRMFLQEIQRVCQGASHAVKTEDSFVHFHSHHVTYSNLAALYRYPTASPFEHHKTSRC
jgi:hypothetical protein